MNLIDIGANLTNGRFGGDLPEVLARAAEAGISQIVVTGTDLDASAQALALADQHPTQLWCTAGIHPHDASSWTADAARSLVEILRAPKVVAVGECGLDFNRNFSSEGEQLGAFEAQLEIAAEVRKPVFLHQRDAHGPFLSLLRQYRKNLAGGVVHCFTGNERELRDYLDLDLYVGITGWIADERRGQALRDAAPHIPLNRILIETDAPYLFPRNHPRPPKGRRNEPALLPWVLRAAAQAMGQTEEDLAEATTQNAQTLFGLPLP
ncbi:MAG: TatD family hydrolase [Myxococcales bacterium]|nr:TatD family hydrolase [Myxococcales bacterium]